MALCFGWKVLSPSTSLTWFRLGQKVMRVVLGPALAGKKTVNIMAQKEDTTRARANGREDSGR